MKLNREQILKALECCFEANTHLDCVRLNCPALINDECFYDGEDDKECDRKQFADTLTLIKELTEDLHATRTELTRVQEENERLSDERDRYKRYYFNHCFDELRANVEADVKADTVRKMQERLHEEGKISLAGCEMFIPIPHSFIDQIAKEMLEGGEHTNGDKKD